MKNLNNHIDSFFWENIKNPIWTKSSKLISNTVWDIVNGETRERTLATNIKNRITINIKL